MKIAMIGSGYVGLVSGACFADFGHDVICVDKDAGKIERLQRGEMPIFEPGLDELVAATCARAGSPSPPSSNRAVRGADAVFIAVGTPSRRGDGHADLSYVYAAAEKSPARWRATPSSSPNRPCRSAPATRSSASFAKSGPTPSSPSSPIPNSCAKARRSTISSAPTASSSAPTTSARAKSCARSTGRLFLNEPPMLFTGRRTSELIKYAANAFLATKITFINEIADLCEKVGADVQDVARGIGLDNRIGAKFLHAGPGYGGSCFPKDTLALHQDRPGRRRAAAHRRGGGRGQRRAQARHGAQGHRRAAAASVRGKTIALLGLTFKPNTDDMRDAPSLAIVAALAGDGASVRAYDPEGMEQARPLMPDVDFCEDAYAAIEGADAVVIVTEWDEFRALDLDRVKKLLKAPVLVDLRNIYRPSDMRKRGFTYVSVGRV